MDNTNKNQDIARQALMRHAMIEANMKQINVYSVGTGRYGINRIEQFSEENGDTYSTEEQFMTGFNSVELALEHATYLTDHANYAKEANKQRNNRKHQSHVGPAMDPNDPTVMPPQDVNICYSVVTIQRAILPEQMPLIREDNLFESMSMAQNKTINERGNSVN